MDKYVGIKAVNAEPMTRGDFNRSKGVDIPRSDAAFSEQGYLVRYPDGYVSWSPKAAFEAAYNKIGENPLTDTAVLMRSGDYQDRFRAEYRQLLIRTKKLAKMLDDWKADRLGFTPECSYDTLHGQLVAMKLYGQFLMCRADQEHISLEAVGTADVETTDLTGQEMDDFFRKVGMLDDIS